MDPGRKLVGSWRMNYHVATVATLNEDQASTLLFGMGDREDDRYGFWYEFAPRDLLVTIDYPLDPGVQVKVSAEEIGGRREVASMGRFLLAVAKIYQGIYKKPKKYGIWGHGIDDLYFERVTVSKHGVVELGIGS